MNLSIPIPDGYVLGSKVDGCRRKEYDGEQKTSRDGSPLWLIRCRFLFKGVPFAIYENVTVPSARNPYPSESLSDMPDVEFHGLRVNVGTNGGRNRYWSLAADSVERVER